MQTQAECFVRPEHQRLHGGRRAAEHLRDAGIVQLVVLMHDHGCALLGRQRTYGLPDAPRLWSLDSNRRRDRQANPATVRRCFACGALNPIKSQICEACGADLLTPRERAEIAMRLREREARERAVSNHVTIRDWPYSRRVAWAGRDVERLRMVATACGYQEGWIFHALREATGATEA